MPKSRVEAFSDAVIAILITVMVLNLRLPDQPTFDALRVIWPQLLTYVLSFIYLGIYWNNHHHMFQAVETVRGGVMWANLHLLFWLSLVPFLTEWMGATRFGKVPTAVYGFALLAAAIAYYVLQQLLIRQQGKNGTLARAVGADIKGKVSPIIYLVALPLAYLSEWIALILYAVVALIWVIPDRRVEAVIVGD